MLELLKRLYSNFREAKEGARGQHLSTVGSAVLPEVPKPRADAQAQELRTFYDDAETSLALCLCVEFPPLVPTQPWATVVLPRTDRGSDG